MYFQAEFKLKRSNKHYPKVSGYEDMSILIINVIDGIIV